MSIQAKKEAFDKEISERVYESAKLTFEGVDGYDVYNCSIPFTWEGKEYIYGRVEKRNEWARSMAALFEKTGKDTYTLAKGFNMFQLEDPYISVIHGELVLGGTHVRKRSGNVDTFYGYFYRGTDLNDLYYFTTGPDFMKDIRLVELADGRIGVFSRPRNDEILKKYGSSAMIGFDIINDLNELTDEVILNATPIEGIFDKGEWGGCNQAYLLENGNIGVIGHQSYTQLINGAKKAERKSVTDPGNDNELAVYLNIAFEFNPETFEVTPSKVIGTRSCYPDGPAKVPNLVDCTFTSGIVVREDGKVDLYGGIGDVGEGRIVIDYPFSCPIVK